MALKRLRLIERRKTLGYTQEQLAEKLGCERTTIIRWERAETEPQPWIRPKVAQALQVTADELSGLLADLADVPGPRDGVPLASSVPLDFSLSSAHTVRTMEGFSAQDVASRRDTLAGFTVVTGAALLRPVRQWAASVSLMTRDFSHIGADELTELEQAVTVFRRWDASGAGGLRRKAVAGQLNAVAETLGERHPPEITKRLFQITAELAQLAGWMAYDQGLLGIAQRYYMLALHACRESMCPDLGAKIIGDMAQLSTALGNYDDSLTLVHTALYSLPHHASGLVRSELLGLEARAYAQLGEQDAAHAARAAEACIAVFAEAPAEPSPGWIHYMDQAEAECLAANVYIELSLRASDRPRWQQSAAKAAVHSMRARESRGDGYLRSQILDEIRLAKVRLAQREPAESAAVGAQAIRLAEKARSTVVVNWLIQFHRELSLRHAGMGEVARFREQLHDYVRMAAPHRTDEL